jgi:DNA-binding NarL/FixJ family response regulator
MAASSPPPGAMRVLLADDDRVFTRALMRTLDADENVEVVGCAPGAREAVDLAASLLPDLVLMGMPAATHEGIESIRLIRKKAPGAQVLVLSGSNRPAEVDLALAAGAAGLVRRDRASADLLSTIFGLALAVALDPGRAAHGRAGPPVTR